MGNYLNAPSYKNRDTNALKTLRKIKTIKCFQVFDEYYDKFYPARDISYEDFDEMFSLLLNDTRKFYEKLVYDNE